MINRITVSTTATLRHLLTLSLLALLGSFVSVAPLHAGVLFTFVEDGGNVVATTSGTIASGWSRPGGGTLTSGSTRTFMNNSSIRYEIAGAARFTQGFDSAWTNNNLLTGLGVQGIDSGVGSGDAFGFSSDSNFYAPAGTNVGDAITPNTTITWAGETFASLGLDTALTTTPLVLFTLNNSETISAVRGEPVPEPTSIAFLATGGLAAGVVAAARRRRRTAARS